jgi:ribose transport system permease protein
MLRNQSIYQGMDVRGKIKYFVKSSPARMALILAAVLYCVTITINPESFNLTVIGSFILMSTLLSISASGQTIVLIGGNIDFSVGSVMSAAAIITTYTMNSQNGRFFQVLAMAVVMGAAVGFCNGFCVVKIGLPPMIVTMAISNIVTRLQYVLTQGSLSGFVSKQFFASITDRILGVVPFIVFYGAGVFAMVIFLLHRSRFGKQVYMVGNNKVAARLNGVKVNKIIILTYIISGILSAFAGMLGAGYMNTARCQIFDDYAFTSLVAVIVGGTSFNGGIGTFAGTMAGALLMTVLSNTLTTLALAQPYRNILNGVIVILLLILYNRSKAVRQ